MITKSNLEKTFSDKNLKVEINTCESPVAPGQLKHHYMPNKPVVLTTESSPFGWVVPDSAALCARELYSKLRELDKSKDKDSNQIIIVLKKEYQDLEDWQGILNRLKKAATIDHYFTI